MWPESKEPKKGKKAEQLRTGLTTGCCATACAIAALECYLSGKRLTEVEVELPVKKKAGSVGSKKVSLKIDKVLPHDNGATAFTTKDAGDDPDVTHGASVWVKINGQKQVDGIEFKAGDGVGVVTKSGLALAVGEPAINPVPRQMIQGHLQDLAESYGYLDGIIVTVGVVNGAELANKTMNPKLGIKGGLSILGTTGIVRPFSCSAYIASIHQGIDVALTNSQHHLIAVTGNQSEQTMRTYHPKLNDMSYIEMGDFVGALLKYLRAKHKKSEVLPRQLTICGGFGKLSKLAAGSMDLHSKVSSIQFDLLQQWADELGASDTLLNAIPAANISVEVLNMCSQENLKLGNKICELCHYHIRKYIPDVVDIDVVAINRKGDTVGCWSDHKNV